MAAFTLFTTCRPFDENYGCQQRSALQSWTHMKPRPEIVLVGDDDGTEQVASELGAIFVPDVKRNELGTPYLGSLFEQAQDAATNNLLAYCNADTILTQSFADAFLATARHLPGPFLMTGLRWALGRSIWTDFSGDWEKRLRVFTCGDHSADIGNAGYMSKPSGMDYFAYRRGVYENPENFPPLVIGRAYWDPWLVWRAMENGADVVDAVLAVFAVHQPHLLLKEIEPRVEREQNYGAAREIGQQAYLWDAGYRLNERLRLEFVPICPDDSSETRRELWIKRTGWDYRK